MGLRVMLSYSWKDSPARAAIVSHLEKVDVIQEVLYDRRTIKGPRELHRAISDMINKADCIVALLSRDALASREVMEELTRANDRRKPIIPVKAETVDQTELPSYLRDIVFITYSPEDMDSILREIEDHVRALAVATPPLSRRAKRMSGHVIVVGSANTETIVDCGADVVLGNKYIVDMKDRFGGSGLNTSLRLLAASCPTLPVLTLGDDSTGQGIQHAICDVCNRSGQGKSIRNFIDAADFLCSDVHTPNTMILVHGGQRTIFAKRLAAQASFASYLSQKLDTIDKEFGNTPAAVLIGHIQSDAEGTGSDGPGESTKMVIERYAGKGPLIYAALGSSQLDLGLDFWEDHLCDVGVFQLNAREAKRFLASGRKSPSVYDIIARFQEMRLTLAITMDHYGAIVTCRDDRNLFVTRPLLRASSVVDSTGAGDAFAAGAVSILRSYRSEFTSAHLQTAIGEGLEWAACACMNWGGVGEDPAEELSRFRRQHPECCRYLPTWRETNHARELLDWIDLGYAS